MDDWPKARNPHAVSARLRKAGAHTSTSKKHGGKRGGSRASDSIEEQLQEYNEVSNEDSQEDQE